MSDPRLFVAVDPPVAAREHLDQALAPLRGATGAPHWVPPERWHLTLLFLGSVPAARVDGLAEALGGAVAGTPPMTLRLAGSGRFGSRRRPAVAWAGVAGDVGVLTELAGRLAAATRRLRLPVEDRPYRPHLTVGRWRPGQPADGDLLDAVATYEGPPWSVPEVLLLRSFLGPTPRYEPVVSWPVTT